MRLWERLKRESCRARQGKAGRRRKARGRVASWIGSKTTSYSRVQDWASSHWDDDLFSWMDSSVQVCVHILCTTSSVVLVPTCRINQGRPLTPDWTD